MHYTFLCLETKLFSICSRINVTIILMINFFSGLLNLQPLNLEKQKPMIGRRQLLTGIVEIIDDLQLGPGFLKV